MFIMRHYSESSSIGQSSTVPASHGIALFKQKLTSIVIGPFSYRFTESWPYALELNLFTLHLHEPPFTDVMRNVWSKTDFSECT